uniref:Signal peptide peptidase-like 2 n=1 Tax=Eptatretus burgeri TaxID=7764 RepID=A0A8C4R724_EPTBU
MAAMSPLIVIALCLCKQVIADMAFLHAEPSGKEYCIQYNPEWARLPRELAKAGRWPVQDLGPATLCGAWDVPEEGLAGALVLANRGNCSFFQKAWLAHQHGATALLVVSRLPLLAPRGNSSQYEEVGIPVALMRLEDAQEMRQNMSLNLRASLFAPPESIVDYNLLLLFLVAVLTVSMAGVFSRPPPITPLTAASILEEDMRDRALKISTVTIGVFVVTSCLMLLLLYYLYDYVVYVIIAVFCISSAFSLYHCLCPLLSCIPYGRCKLSPCPLPGFRSPVEVRRLILAIACAALVAVWVVFRNEDSWAWILQDLLCAAFCLCLLLVLHMPSFKACTLLFCCLFLYDIFFVFITPFITRGGESIMVEVATGPSTAVTREKLPMVIKAPRLSPTSLAVCERPFSLIGLGDILVPGLLVTYCRRFDLYIGPTSIPMYFPCCILAYSLGLFFSLLALVLTQQGQPALLYLVPWHVAHLHHTSCSAQTHAHVLEWAWQPA